MEKGVAQKMVLGGLLAAVLLVCGIPAGEIGNLSAVQAEDYKNLNPADSGDCSAADKDNVQWAVYDTDGDSTVDTLVISGQGEVKDVAERVNQYGDIPLALVIEDGITRIGALAFNGMDNLTGALALPDSVKVIDMLAFCSCSNLDGELTIPADIEEIGEFAFSGCNSLKGQVVLPQNVEKIPNFIYNNCESLTGPLKIPEGVTEIGNSAFNRCSGLTGALTLPDGLERIGSDAFNNCSGFTGKLAIPQAVESIGGRAFFNCTKLTGDLIIPEGVKEIELRTFYGCEGFDGKLSLPQGLETIGSGAFCGCKALTGELVLPDSLIEIKTDAFSGCSGFTGDLSFPEGISSIGMTTFYGCKNMSGTLVIPETVKEIGEAAFTSCGFTALSLPEGLESIGVDAFRQCSSLTGKLVLPSTVKTIEKSSFRSCNFTALSLPEGLESIGREAFMYNPFQSDIVIPEGVKTIGAEAFEYGRNMKGKVFIIPYSVESAGTWAFYRTEATVYDLSGSVSEADLDSKGSLNTVTKMVNGKQAGRAFLPQGVHDELAVYHQFPLDAYDDTENIIWYRDAGYQNRITAPVTVTADMTVYGKEKAEQTGFAVTDVPGLVYGGGDFVLETTGGQSDGAVTFSVPKENGVLTLSGNRAVIVGAGTVTVTAEKAGNADYKPVAAVKEITVSPKTVTESMVGEIAQQRYTGSPIIPEVIVRDGDNLLTRSRDYTVEYINNTAIGEKTGENPPTAVIKGMKNYTGEIKRFFTIMRPAAEVAIAEGKEQIAKIYGDDSFILEGITQTGDGALTYAVKEGEEVIAVSQTGEVSIKKAGTAVIAVSTKETVNYSPAAEKIITVTVDKALKAPYMPLSKLYVNLDCEKVGDVSLFTGWEWNAEDAEKTLVTDEAVTANAVYTGADKGNYKTEAIEVSIIRTDCAHVTGEVILSEDCECDQPPTCEKTGFGHKECVKCHHIVEVYIEISALGHTGGRAGCSSKAVCERCGKEYGELDSSEHGEIIVKDGKAAACTEDGYSGNKYCRDCGKKLEDGTVTKAAGHKWDAGRITKKATAKEKGEITYTCSVCGQTRTEELIATGAVITDDATKAVYRVTKADNNGNSGTVQYVRPTNKGTKKINIPDTVTVNGKKYKITSISPGAFKNMKKLTRVTIGNSVITIGANVFSGCKALTAVTMGKNVKVIGNKAFYKCVKLKKIVIPAKVESIGKQAFFGCKSLKTITVKTKKLTAKKVGSKAFKGIAAKAKIKVPKSRKKAYRKLLKSKGAGAKVKVQ
ncbi:MAG: leucine-rich repeat domain-containing protein [Bacteroidales bacterium]|nr:leucine-rich repeat domain-containing protein [Clostridium sp.]MCM1203441.1 leucine-rich repeat domain-containing protein [Bacteroidales bacterium]